MIRGPASTPERARSLQWLTARSWLLAILVSLAVVFMAGTAAAASSREGAAAAALQQNGGSGRVLGVREQQDSSGRRVFAVTILTNGRVRIILVPAD